MYAIEQAPPHQFYSIATRVATTPFEILQSIHNKHNQLKQRVFRDMNSHQKAELIAEYAHSIGLTKTTDMQLWSPHQIMQLRCYRMSLCLGIANVYGAMCDNKMQLNYAISAYEFLSLLKNDIKNAYLDRSDLFLIPTLLSAARIMCRSVIFLGSEEKKLLLWNIINDNQLIPARDKAKFLECLINNRMAYW